MQDCNHVIKFLFFKKLMETIKLLHIQKQGLCDALWVWKGQKLKNHRTEPITLADMDNEGGDFYYFLVICFLWDLTKILPSQSFASPNPWDRHQATVDYFKCTQIHWKEKKIHLSVLHGESQRYKAWSSEKKIWKPWMLGTIKWDYNSQKGNFYFYTHILQLHSTEYGEKI